MTRIYFWRFIPPGTVGTIAVLYGNGTFITYAGVFVAGVWSLYEVFNLFRQTMQSLGADEYELVEVGKPKPK